MSVSKGRAPDSGAMRTLLVWLTALAAGLSSSMSAGAAKQEDAQCLACHAAAKNADKILSIGKTKHGTAADGRTPGCTSCHGTSQAHMSKRGGVPPDRVFKDTTPSEVQNEACTSCHKGGNHMFWESSTHRNRGVTCTNCHDIHNGGHDKARDKQTQTEVCYACHKDQRAQMNRPHRHPVPEGKVTCSDCHNPHGSTAPKQLKKDSVNETCYQCHTEKRGPFIHNHQPVTEDCTICHNPHGSTVANLLKQRMPLLCQNCHSSDSHRTQLVQQLSGRSTSTGALGAMGRGCTNCHSNIHGGNSTQNSLTVGRFRR